MTTATIPAKTTRLQRGVRLFLERGAEIERTTANTYRVPSCSGEGSYLVYLDFRCCTCPDHRAAKAAGERCKHFHAAGIAAAKLRTARQRVAGLAPGRREAEPHHASGSGAPGVPGADRQGETGARAGRARSRRPRGTPRRDREGSETRTGRRQRGPPRRAREPPPGEGHSRACGGAFGASWAFEFSSETG